MTIDSPRSQRFHILDASRGVAALGVLIFHVFYPSPLRQFMGLYVLVDFFFVLSGFVLYPSMPKHINNFAKDGPRFILSRVVRLWPTVIASIAVSMGLYWWKQFSASRSDTYFNIDPNRSPSLIAAAFFLLQILIPLSGAIFIVVPFWSLSSEWFANIIFAPLTLIKGQIGIILGIGFGYFSLYYGLIHDSEWISSLGPIRGWQALGRGLIGFGIGLLVRANLERLMVIRNRVGLLITTALTIWAFTIWQSYTFTHLYFVSPILGLVILQLTQFEFSSVGKAAKVSTLLGTYSYGIYAFHILALEFYDYNVLRLNEFADSGEWWHHLIIKSIVVIIASTLATFLTLKLIDQPIQRRGRALIRRIFTPTA